MEYIKLFFTNRILIAGLLGWAAAQVLKTIIYLIINKELRLERLFGDGGMPSGHSATVSAVALSTGLECGFDSAVFAVAFIMAIIVMHDAAGVRLETGKQAKVINDMMEMFHEMATTGVTMAVLVTLVWGVMCVVTSAIEKRAVEKEATE